MIVRVNVVLDRTVIVDDHTQPTYQMTPGFKPFTVVHNSPMLTSALFLLGFYIENSRIQELPFFGNTNKNGRMK